MNMCILCLLPWLCSSSCIMNAIFARCCRVAYPYPYPYGFRYYYHHSAMIIVMDQYAGMCVAFSPHAYVCVPCVHMNLH